MRHRGLSGAVLAVLALLGPAHARGADDPAPEPEEAALPPEAVASYRQAVADYRAGRFEDARRGFAAVQAGLDGAGMKARAARQLYNLAICSEKLGRYPEAIELYEHYLTAFPGAGDRQNVLDRVAFMEERLLAARARLGVEAEAPGASVSLLRGRERVGGCPAPCTLWPEPGDLVVRAEADGAWPGEARISVRAGERRTVRLSGCPKDRCARVAVESLPSGEELEIRLPDGTWQPASAQPFVVGLGRWEPAVRRAGGEALPLPPLDLAAGEERTLGLPPECLRASAKGGATAQPFARGGPEPGIPPAVWAGSGLALACLAAGLSLGLAAWQAEEDANTYAGPSRAEFESLRDRAEERTLFANAAHAAAGVAALTTVGLYWLLRPQAGADRTR